MNENVSFLIGRCAGVPQLKTYKTKDGVTGYRCWFKLAVCSLMDRGKPFADQDTSFFDIVTWGDAAKRHAQYIGKGDALSVVGELKSKSEKDEATGKYTTHVNINARSIQYLARSPKNETPEGLAKKAEAIQTRLDAIKLELAAGTDSAASEMPAAETVATDTNPFTENGEPPVSDDGDAAHAASA